MIDLLDGVESTLAAKKVSIVEFAESEEYCDKPLYPRQRVLLKLFFLEELEGWEEDILDHWISGGTNNEVSISPNIRERVQYLRDRNYDHFREVVLVGGRRSSKGYCTGIAATKVLWDTLQLQDPGRHFGIDVKKEIYFSCVAASEDQAKQYQFADFINTVEGCKPIRDQYLQRSLETEFRVATPADLRAMDSLGRNKKKMQREIARLRGKALAANAGTIRGSASMVIIFDEMAHMLDSIEGKASAAQVYSAAKPSLDQFGKAAMIFCNSSPYSKIGKFFQRHEEAMLPFDSEREVGMPDETGNLQGNGNPYMFSFQFPSWALYEGYQKDPQKRFHQVHAASPNWKPDAKDEEGNDFWSEQDKEGIQQMRVEEASNPDTFKVERRGKFAEVEDAYLSPEMIDRMYAGAPIGYDEEGKLLLDPLSTDWGHGARVMYNYVAHLDPSSTTAGFGFALGHVEKFKHKDGQVRDHVIFDIIKRWQPDHFEGGAIDWETVNEEIIHYCDIFRPSQISFDQYQSDAPIQHLTKKFRELGIETQVHLRRRTNERNWKQAESFKTALYQGLVHAPKDTPDDEWSSLELKFLVKKATTGRAPRVDRQEVGPVQTKDMADCIMEVTEVLVGNLVARSIRDQLSESMSLGAKGGYSIGGVQQGVRDAPELTHFYGNQTRAGEQSLEPSRIGPRRRRAGLPMRGRGISRGGRRR